MVAVFTVCERIMYGYMWRSISIFIRRTFCGGRVESNVLHDLIGTVTTISDILNYGTGSKIKSGAKIDRPTNPSAS